METKLRSKKTSGCWVGVGDEPRSTLQDPRMREAWHRTLLKHTERLARGVTAAANWLQPIIRRQQRLLGGECVPARAGCSQGGCDGAGTTSLKAHCGVSGWCVKCRQPWADAPRSEGLQEKGVLLEKDDQLRGTFGGILKSDY